MLQDIAILTGGQVIWKSWVSISKKPRSNNLAVPAGQNPKENTIIVDGAGSDSEIKARIGSIRAQIEETTSDFDRENCRSVWLNFPVVLFGSVQPPKPR